MSTSFNADLLKYLTEDEEFKAMITETIEKITEISGDKDFALSILIGTFAARFNNIDTLIACLEGLKFTHMARVNMGLLQIIQTQIRATEKNPLSI